LGRSGVESRIAFCDVLNSDGITISILNVVCSARAVGGRTSEIQEYSSREIMLCGVLGVKSNGI
jgi:hypothetical protein